jgi:hypothetical protein
MESPPGCTGLSLTQSADVIEALRKFNPDASKVIDNFNAILGCCISIS